MGKSKSGVPPVSQAIKDLKSGRILPVYYLYGADTYSIEQAVNLVQQTVQPFIASDFDKETFHCEDKSIYDILDFAAAFPFGSEKKLIIVKDIEKVRDKKGLTNYAASPADFSVLVLIHNGTISGAESEPFKTLNQNGYLFEAKELKGNNLLEWLLGYAESKGKILTAENAQILLDIAGENRAQLEAQLEKIFVFLGDKKEITIDTIRDLSTSLKEYTIFDLQNAVAKKDKSTAFKVAYHLLEKGNEPTFIISMLTKYFTGLTRINELREKNTPEQTAARIVGTHPYYYKDYLRARSIYSDKELFNAARALLKADLSIKTSTADEKSVIAVLLAEILV